MFAGIIAMLSEAPPPLPPPSYVPAVASLSGFPVQPEGPRGVFKGNSAEQYCLSIILSAAIAFVEVRNIYVQTLEIQASV